MEEILKLKLGRDPCLPGLLAAPDGAKDWDIFLDVGNRLLAVENIEDIQPDRQCDVLGDAGAGHAERLFQR